MRLGQPLSARGANEGPFRGDAEQRYAWLLFITARQRLFGRRNLDIGVPSCCDVLKAPRCFR